MILAGTITYACVLHTAFDANVRDLDVIVASDGTASWAPDLQGPTLRIVDLILGGTAATGEIIEALAIGNRGKVSVAPINSSFGSIIPERRIPPASFANVENRKRANRWPTTRRSCMRSSGAGC